MVTSLTSLSLTGAPRNSQRSLPFAAPERLSRDAIVDDFKADWWSFGALTFYLLAGRAPFFDREPRKHFENILRATPDFTKIPSTAEKTLKALLAKDPLLRITGRALKKAPCFNTLNWDDSLRKLIKPPHRPPHFLLYEKNESHADDESKDDPSLATLALY